jgi:hypothetical protein
MCRWIRPVSVTVVEAFFGRLADPCLLSASAAFDIDDQRPLVWNETTTAPVGLHHRLIVGNGG